MPTLRLSGVLPSVIMEGSGPAAWVGSLAISGATTGLAAIDAIGPGGLFFGVAWDAALGLATIRPAAAVDFEAFLAAGTAPELTFSLRFRFGDGTVQDDPTVFRVGVLDRDDTPPTGLRFASGGSVTAGAIGSVIGTLAVTDPDSAGPFLFSFTPEDEWRFEVIGTTLKLKDGISLGLDDMPSRPLIIQVSDGRQSAAFTLDLAVRDPGAGQSSIMLLDASAPQHGVSLVGTEAVTLREAREVAAVLPYGGGITQLRFADGDEVWLPPVAKLRFADGWFDLGGDGHWEAQPLGAGADWRTPTPAPPADLAVAPPTAEIPWLI